MRSVLRPSPLVCSLLALALAGCGDSTGSSGPRPEPPEVIVDNFDANTLGSYTIHNTPHAWSWANGRLNASPAAFQSVLIRNGATMTDGWVQTVTDDADDGGLVLRFQGNGDYYLLAIRDDSRFSYANYEIYRVVDGEFINIAGPVDRQFVQGVHKTIGFEADGSWLRAYVDGVLVLQARDVAYTSGGFGLRHNNSEDAIGVTSRFELLGWASYDD
jgi:hypothetical protein